MLCASGGLLPLGRRGTGLVIEEPVVLLRRQVDRADKVGTPLCRRPWLDPLPVQLPRNAGVALARELRLSYLPKHILLGLIRTQRRAIGVQEKAVRQCAAHSEPLLP